MDNYPRFTENNESDGDVGCKNFSAALGNETHRSIDVQTPTPSSFLGGVRSPDQSCSDATIPFPFVAIRHLPFSS